MEDVKSHISPTEQTKEKPDQLSIARSHQARPLLFSSKRHTCPKPEKFDLRRYTGKGIMETSTKKIFTFKGGAAARSQF